VAQAQQRSHGQWRIGQVLVGTAEGTRHLAVGLQQQLAKIGYQDGREITIIARVAAPRSKSAEEVIAALLPEIDILIVGSTVGGVAARKMAPDVPTVFLAVGAPVEIGLVQSLAHPGGNMTGITFEAASETYGKRLQLLKEMLPRLARIAVLRPVDDANAGFAMPSLEQSAPGLGVSLLPIDVRSADDLEGAFANMQRERADAVLVVAGALTYSNTKRISDLALERRLPSCHPFREAVQAGGLVSLGPDLLEMTAQVAGYVDKIIRGARPADLPVQQPSRYEMYLNLKTARLLDIAVPPALLARADEVIE
jgi:putative ABC transport system substrate-binding protein